MLLLLETTPLLEQIVLRSNIPTTSVTQTAFNDNTSQFATVGYVSSFVANSTLNVPLATNFYLQNNVSVNYSNAYYATGVLGKSTFTLSQSGRATFSFSPQPNPNPYNNNNAYLQLLSPSWTNANGGATYDMSSVLNGAPNPILLANWNSISTMGVGKYTFPFNPATLAQANQYGQNMYSIVLYYPTNTTYYQSFTAKVSIWTGFDLSQNVSLYIYIHLLMVLERNLQSK